MQPGVAPWKNAEVTTARLASRCTGFLSTLEGVKHGFGSPTTGAYSGRLHGSYETWLFALYISRRQLSCGLDTYATMQCRLCLPLKKRHVAKFQARAVQFLQWQMEGVLQPHRPTDTRAARTPRVPVAFLTTSLPKWNCP
ncbi:uncharacterized protein LOC121836436 [Ixodes scapularis]|uniref:uncharacterized protein LOC121836228 n=1 Tax=Ixodes scapularis TaxID=6945 RepID=UPI001C39514A|nr:uncharacterized protein LOC121836228 [Ixodes scapularis]XP_042147268.1 uncharacterized protein LOC121836436 [Ixodes scapularis]